MKSRNDILNELRELSPLLASMPKEDVFVVPEGYFASFSEILQEKITTLSFGVPAGTKAPVPGAIPEQYFETLPGEILQRIRSLEAVSQADELPAWLVQRDKKPLFDVPPGYFDTFPGQLVQELNKTAVTGKLVRFSRGIPVLKYAVAAMLTGIVALGTYRYVNQETDRLPQAVVTAATLDPVVAAGKNMTAQQFDEKMQHLSADDISLYLEKNISESDIALMEDGNEPTELPGKETYLPDESSIQHALNEIITQN